MMIIVLIRSVINAVNKKDKIQSNMFLFTSCRNLLT